jgi:hypothetical protein
METKQMPTTKVLNVLSWLILFGGILAAIALIVFGYREMRTWLNGFLISAVSVVLAAFVRMFAIIGQILFDIKYETIRVKNILERNGALLEKNGALLEKNGALLEKNGARLEKNGAGLEQINCDSKDIAENIHQIKTFFEQIEKHLDLKK